MAAEAGDLDEVKLEQVLGQLVVDMGAAMNGALVLIGVDLGLWRALDDAGPMDSSALAEATGIRERYIREWLAAQAASGYLTYDAHEETFTLPPEQAMAFARDDSPVYMAGGYHLIGSVFKDLPKITERIGKGEGFGWHEHDRELFSGTEQFFRPGYRANLVESWLPALDGVVDKLSAGATVADVGCGHGVSTTLIAQAFPNSRVHGFDYHDASIERARELATEQGAENNTDFSVASASDYPGSGYDLICYFDCLHDMGDPVGALRHARETLSDDGSVMLVEPFANDSLAENLNPVGRMYYAASTVLCTPSSLDQPVALGLGAQAGEQRLGEVAAAAGFSSFRRVSETPFNLVLEARH
ncbi:MAG: class I SAM-dependent methyltransferase [Rhodococcus sp. (in: high G+C Gram-positive bacteria)]|jgi:2-polyprenyl-3-methyl-5-hydroxy-6-metoxy-1,4-benzoquinol methylase|uniref:class I SAM-dependent methyltransferase n=1 Tax=Rhodococcus sp. EPR-157 TaxID=1813677 RepID=UPI0007BB466F|nr:class I SAM-dependent methyltransferase [Rhodococcus sp. EPR-157]KZF02178.1 SAM-dependent methyltransferase [Rhodococcus sp. EPR-157]